ncbi:transposase [Streptomyces sp. NPDC091682]|uniref:transposase n=1 Tax=Streptomyces sp. NPDC091682 TaxID=3366005 RepID=UPI00382BF491
MLLGEAYDNCSLARAVERSAHQQRACRRKDAETSDLDQPQEPPDPGSLAALITLPEPDDPPDAQLLARVRQWHTDIHRIRERGWTISAIARHLGRDRRTVRHYLTKDFDQIIATARDLAHEFSAIARERRGQDLTHWTARALEDRPSPIQGFAALLQNDWGAVMDGLTLPWSSGAVEGQGTRIRLIKRRS